LLGEVGGVWDVVDGGWRGVVEGVAFLWGTVPEVPADDAAEEERDGCRGDQTRGAREGAA
jgi:hypothetical protein